MAINGRDQSNYSRSASTCKFCATEGHTLAKCPSMEETYAKVKKLSIEQRNFKENYAVQYIDKKKSKVTKTGVKKVKKCGYCREEGHNRKACPTMVADKELIIKGNKVWRRMWASNAKEYGLVPASLVTVKDRCYNYNQGGYTHKDHLCTVGAELPSNLTIFALGEDGRQQEIEIPLLGYKPEHGSGKVRAKTVFDRIDEALSRKMFAYTWGGSSIVEFNKLSPSTYEFPEGWLDKPPTEDIDFALKKWTKDQMTKFLMKVENLIASDGGTYGIQ
jgi:hypothetical protein